MILGRMERDAGMFFNKKNLDNNEYNITSEKNPIRQEGYYYEYKIDEQFLF